jgi:hypothetical protein
LSTLAEIEAAAAVLTAEEKQKLIRFLTARLNGETPAEQQTDLNAFSGTIHLLEDPSPGSEECAANGNDELCFVSVSLSK